MENLRFFHQDFCAWLETQNYAKATITNYSSIIAQFSTFLQNKQVSSPTEISALHIHQYFHHLKSRRNYTRGAGLSVGTVNRHLTSLKLFQTYLNVKHQIYVPIVQKKLQDWVKLPDILTKDEIRSLYETCDVSEPSGYVDKAILSLCYGAGLRRGEAVGLGVRDIDLDARVIHVRNTKSNKERLVPITVWVMQELKEYVLMARPVLNVNKLPDFLLNSKGRVLTTDQIYLRFKSLLLDCREESLYEKTISLHSLRRSYATHLLASGMSLQNIARLLGHSSLETTKIYTQIIENGRL